MNNKQKRIKLILVFLNGLLTTSIILFVFYKSDITEVWEKSASLIFAVSVASAIAIVALLAYMNWNILSESRAEKHEGISRLLIKISKEPICFLLFLMLCVALLYMVFYF